MGENTFRGAILVLLLARGAFAGDARPKGHVDRDLGLRFPAKLAGLDFEEVKSYGSAALGYHVRYSGTHAGWADIFVYDKGYTDIATGCDTARVRAEATMTAQALKMLEQRGKYTGVRLLQEGTAGGDGPVQFVWNRYQFAYPEEVTAANPAHRVSECYVTGYARKFVKIRYTYRELHTLRGQWTATGLVKGVSRMLLDAAKPTAERAPKFTIMLGGGPGGKPQQAWLAYLLGLQGTVQKSLDGKPLLPGIVAPRYVDEVAARDLMAGIWQGVRADDANAADAYLDALLAVRRAGFMSEYVWEFLRQPGWTQPDGMNLAKFAAWRDANLAGHRAQTRGYLLIELAPVAKQKREADGER